MFLVSVFGYNVNIQRPDIYVLDANKSKNLVAIKANGYAQVKNNNGVCGGNNNRDSAIKASLPENSISIKS